MVNRSYKYRLSERPTVQYFSITYWEKEASVSAKNILSSPLWFRTPNYSEFPPFLSFLAKEL